MIAPNVHILHPTSQPLAAFLRVGHTGYHKLEALHAADRLGFSRLVFDAAHALGQADFLRSQKAAGREIIIDLNVAETTMPGRFGSAVGKLPWGNPDRPWAPAHAAEGDEWRSVDIRATERLRMELDRVGAKDVAIDHLVIIGAQSSVTVRSVQRCSMGWAAFRCRTSGCASQASAQRRQERGHGT